MTTISMQILMFSFLNIEATIFFLIIIKHLKRNQMTNEEAIAKVTAQGLQLDKVFLEVKAIKDALANAGGVITAELEAAINTAGEKTQAVDDLNEDAPVV
jgi:glutamate dehydrogenase/leucine dehydrogenase